jgi:adenylosuccinate synthase
MPATVVIGTQWGDEGKGKAIDYLARQFDFVARYNGGNNAGHTVINEFGAFKIHLVPSGIFYPHTRGLMGNGMVIDPAVLLDEMNEIRNAGIDFEKRLFISKRAHLIMPYHKILDGLYEDAKGAGAMGTTRRGIGPAFADKVSYNGIRVGDLAEANTFAARLRMQIALKNKIILALGGDALDYDKVYETYRGYFEQLKPYLAELFAMVQNALREQKKFLLEQAMGTQLDTDWGTYPFVTGSNTIVSAATSGLGVPPREIKRVVGVTKVYTTRVGGGPLPTELRDERDRAARETLTEIAATTGRTRRAGWLDLEPVKFAAQLNGITDLFLTKLDVLSEFDTLKVAVGYKGRGRTITYAEASTEQLGEVEPIYRELRGWQADIRAARKFSDLPRAARHYVEFIEKQTGVSVSWISVGPERDAVIKR